MTELPVAAAGELEGRWSASSARSAQFLFAAIGEEYELKDCRKRRRGTACGGVGVIGAVAVGACWSLRGITSGLAAVGTSSELWPP